VNGGYYPCRHTREPIFHGRPTTLSITDNAREYLPLFSAIAVSGDVSTDALPAFSRYSTSVLSETFRVQCYERIRLRDICVHWQISASSVYLVLSEKSAANYASPCDLKRRFLSGKEIFLSITRHTRLALALLSLLRSEMKISSTF